MWATAQARSSTKKTLGKNSVAPTAEKRATTHSSRTTTHSSRITTPWTSTSRTRMPTTTRKKRTTMKSVLGARTSSSVSSSD